MKYKRIYIEFNKERKKYLLLINELEELLCLVFIE